ncbi:hypothetical protein ACFLMW_003830 [Salmonella enterica]
MGGTVDLTTLFSVNVGTLSFQSSDPIIGEITGNTLTYKAVGTVTITASAPKATDQTLPITIKAAIAWDGPQPSTGTIGTPLVFQWKGGSGNYDFAAAMSGKEFDRNTQTATTYSLVTAGKTAGTWAISVTDNGTNDTITTTVTVAAPVKTVDGKTLDGKIGGTVIPKADLFDLSNAALTDVTGVTTVQGKATWDNTAGTLTLGEDITDDFTVTFAVKTGVVKGTDISFTNVVPKTKLTPITPVPTLKVGAPDMNGSALFTPQPGNKPFAIAIDPSDTSGSATVVGGKLHAVKPGTAKVKGLIVGDANATATTNVTIIPPDLTGVILKDSNGDELDWVDDTDHTQGYAFDGGNATTPTAETELTIVPVPQYAVLPADATIAIASGDVTVATVPAKPTSGKFKVKPLTKDGDAIITVTVKTGMVIKLTVHVDAAP